MSRNGNRGNGSRSRGGSHSNSHHSGSGSGKRKGTKSLQSYPQFEGTVQMSREGFIFVTVPGEQDDIFVKATKTRNALNGDTVRVALTKEKTGNKRREGEVVEIIQRSTRPHVGVLHFVGSQAWVLMQSKAMPYDIEIDQQQALELGGKTGMKAAVVVDRWEKYDIGPKGHVVDVLGMPGENDTEMHAILAEFGLPYRFEPAVENAADGISEEITKKDLKGRKDFRDTLTFTIDPADAKDFDDALSFRKLENGNFEVGVHIADVSYYVRPGSLVDEEAQARGTSVYLVDRTVPMLPEKLCNKLCSLRPNEDKLTFSAVFEITPKAKVENRWMGRTVIRSDWRFDYEQAQEIIEAAMGTAADVPAELKDAVLTLNKLALQFRKKRFATGAMNFDRPEMKVEVDAAGKPVNVYEKVSKEANWLIEEFMLLANRTVAEFIATDGKMNGVASKKAKTFVYRIHDEPNMEKISGLRDVAGNFGYKMGDTNSPAEVAKSLNELLATAKGTPSYDALQIIALRSMAKAKYSTDNIGHYGLAFKFYTHFTSPIRRYPDLMVHRLLAKYQEGQESQDKGYYEAQCVHASEREIIAAEAERSSIKYKLVEFMQDKIGQEFDAHVSGVTEWGLYAEIEPTKVEGMIPLRTIKSDYFEFDEKNFRLVGRRTRKIFNLGDPVKIRVKATSLEQKLLDYELVEPTVEDHGQEGKAMDPHSDGHFYDNAPKSRKSGNHRKKK
ncbi:MAG: ribonuclease R [Bacteroidia bacterium]|nr:ribonuclease R [Bacteroidia bacterium]